MATTQFIQTSNTVQALGLDTLEQALGELAAKSPGAARDAINRTATRARRLMIAEARARYALLASGERHLRDLRQTKRASPTSLSAELKISKPKNDLGYFEHEPEDAFTGRDVFTSSPEHYRGHVLRANPMKELPVHGNLSKGFTMNITNGEGQGTHHGMVRRVIGSSGGPTETRRHRPRWVNSQGNVEKLMTYSSASAAAMHNVVFQQVEPEIEQILMEQLDYKVQAILNKYRGRTR